MAHGKSCGLVMKKESPGQESRPGVQATGVQATALERALMHLQRTPGRRLRRGADVLVDGRPLGRWAAGGARSRPDLESNQCGRWLLASPPSIANIHMCACGRCFVAAKIDSLPCNSVPWPSTPTAPASFAPSWTSSRMLWRLPWPLALRFPTTSATRWTLTSLSLRSTMAQKGHAHPHPFPAQPPLLLRLDADISATGRWIQLQHILLRYNHHHQRPPASRPKCA